MAGTPPSIAEGSRCAGPPRRLEDYADFISQVVDEFGHAFSHLELWNEPNNRYKWDFRSFDPRWEKFGRMIQAAAQVARRRQKPAVLGGMIPVDHHWLKLIESYGALDDIDVIAIHAFPCMWWPDEPNWDWHRNWQGWTEKIDYIAGHTNKPIWVTETGLATWQMERRSPGRFDLQSDMLQQAFTAPAERLYWYSLIDLAPQREAIEGFHVDENEYHMGLVTCDLEPKPAFFALQRLLGSDRRPRVPMAAAR